MRDERFSTLLVDIAILWSLNIRVVLVLGIAAEVRALAGDRGVTASNADGTGAATPTLGLSVTAANPPHPRDSRGLATNDLRAACTGIVAHAAGVIQGVDQVFTGKVERVDTGLLQALLAQGVIPIVPPLGFDGEGRTYRVNSDGMAVAVAAHLRAVKLIYVTTSPGLVHRGQPIRQMMVARTRRAAAERSRRLRGRALLEGPACGPRLPRRRAASTSSTAPSTRGCSARCSRTTASAPSSTPTNKEHPTSGCAATSAPSSSSSARVSTPTSC